MNQNLENLKKEQNQIDLLRIQKEHAEQLAEDRFELLEIERIRHKNTRSWAQILTLLLVLSIGFSILIICQASKTRERLENIESQNLYNQHNEAPHAQ